MESPQQNSPVVVHFEKRVGNIKYDQGDQYPGSSSKVFTVHCASLSGCYMKVSFTKHFYLDVGK